MDTKTLAAAIIGFLFGGLTVSVAAQIEGAGPEGSPHGTSQHRSIERHVEQR